MSSDPEKFPLASFQKWMMEMLLDPYQQVGKAAGHLPENLRGKRLDAIVEHSEKLPAHEHLAIYQRGYIARLRHCMAQQFSALEYALGEELFSAFADEYLSGHPSTSYNLANLGAGFAAFLQANRPDQAGAPREDWPDFMIELAELENTINIAFEEKAEENYILADLDTPDDQLEPIPVCHLLKFRFPVRWFYSEFKNDREPEIPTVHESYAIILRYNYRIALHDLHREQYEFLGLMKAGKNLAEARSTFVESHPHLTESFDQVWPQWKERWIAAKFFRLKR